MHSSLKKGLFLVTFLGMTVSPGISVIAADGDTAEAAKMPGVGKGQKYKFIVNKAGFRNSILLILL